MNKWIRYFLILFLVLQIKDVFANDFYDIERRRSAFRYDFSYYFFPIVQKVPGLGQASGVGTTIVDIAETDIDLIAVTLDGAFTFSTLTLLNLHLIPESLIFDLGGYRYDVAVRQFDRGIDSDKDRYILARAVGDGYQGQLTLSFLNRRLEFFHRVRNEDYFLPSVFDKDGTEFESNTSDTYKYRLTTEGIRIDYTDDYQDPRKGIRVEGIHVTPLNEDPNISDYSVIDQNFTFFLPIGERNTLAFNYFRSQATITNAATTDRNELRNAIGLGCEKIPVVAVESKTKCETTENALLDERIAFNKYGRATPIGGTQRLRAYPNQRFYGGNSLYYGTEFRWNLNDEKTPFNYFIMKGVRTGFQIAFFAGNGSVADDTNQLSENMKSIYGAGFRVIFDGVTVRLDYATGDEGSEVIVFIDYPWSLNALDNSNR